MKKTGGRIYTFLVFLFLYAPILVLIVFSFNDTETASRTVWSGFSFKWYQKLFEDRLILEAQHPADCRNSGGGFHGAGYSGGCGD